MRILFVIALCLFASPALAQEPSPSSSPTAPKTASQGVAVLAIGNSTEATWTLAQKIYARPTLRPAGLDEPHARVLAGEMPAADAPKDLRDLADTRLAIRGDDAPSRQLLASIASTFSVRGVVVVDVVEGGPRARLFLADPPSFDAASWSPVADEKGSPSWEPAVRSLERTLQPKSASSSIFVSTPPPPKTNEKTDESRPFYASPWFWGALGGAAFLGGAIYFASRDSSPGSIHLQVTVPR
jgi:hypothetical protein